MSLSWIKNTHSDEVARTSMKKMLGIGASSRSIGTLSILIVICFVVPNRWANAALNSARVTQVIQDVKLLPSNAAPRPAAVNDDVRKGVAVRTGPDSRTELTFTDKTLTRLGANSIFSFNTGARTFDLGQGSILMQVPPDGSSVKVKTAAVTAAITGGTAIFGVGPPVKFMVLEGTGTFYPAGHPEQAVTLKGGEMVTLTPDGQIIKQEFDVKLVLETSELIVNFPDLANLPLILEVIAQQQSAFLSQSSSPPPKNIIDIIDQKQAASTPTPTETGTPSKFGAPSTISSPNPYVITSGTQIQTDPIITTNGVTDFGKIYQGQATDGPFSAYAFGSTSSFDTASGFDNNITGSGAVFKFQSLQLTGNPTVSTTNGETSLALIGVDGITSGGPGGPLTFAGINGLLFATQNGSINLGSEISFSGFQDLNFYARGSGSNLTLASPISGITGNLRLFSEGTIQLNGDIGTANLRSFSGGDFLAGSGVITATNINIQSLANINIDSSKFPNPPGGGGAVVLNAANTLNIAITGGSGSFGWDSLAAQGTTINLTSPAPTTFNLSNSSSVIFTAGTGGINAPNIDFFYKDLTLLSGAGINIRSATRGPVHTDATISAATSFNASGNVDAGTLTTGTTVDVGGALFVEDTLTAGGNINVGNYLRALNINAPSGILTVQEGIYPVLLTGGAALQHTFNVDSIVSPNGIDFSGNQFDGEAGLSSGGLLTINATTLTFNAATGIAFADFNGADSGAFSGGGPSEGGDGGVFIVNATGNITTVVESDITATTGTNSDAGVYSGAGGSVTLRSSAGMVTVDDRIEVSSDDFKAQRQSASGGTILLQSDLTTGAGITLGGNAQLLSLLNANAPGPGGSITLSTMGADITVMGRVEADRGTITIDQNDPVGPTPLITIDGATLVSDILNINAIGDVNIAQTSPTTLTFSTATLQADNNVNWNTAQSTLPASINSLDVTAGNALNLTGGSSDIAGTLTLNMQNPSTLTAGAGGINAQYTDIFYSGGELNLISGGNITARSIVFTDFFARGTVNAAGAITITGDLWQGIITAGTDVNVGGSISISTLTAGATVTAGQYISASSVSAGGDITADSTRVQYITSPTGVLRVASGIRPDVFSTDPQFPEQGAAAPHIYTVDSIVSPNGIDFSGNQFGGIRGYSSGGILTVNASTLRFDSEIAVGDANFNGADAGALDFGGNPFTTVGGDGGVFIVNATGDIAQGPQSSISATTGLNDPNLSDLQSSGAGGTVELNSSDGQVAVAGTIQVSSAEPTSTIKPFRSSAKGGNINLTSGKTSGVAINIGSSGQLLALLDAAAPGPGGKITIVASKPGGNAANSSSIDIDNANGQIVADRGTVEIRHDGDAGTINLSNANIRADVVKVGALGTNGALTIGGGTTNIIGADNILKLYAPGSNGELKFISNVTLSSGSAMYLAAGKITINPTYVVTINGDGGAANIYTNNPNYNFTPQVGYTGPAGNPANGTFGGNGALDPKPLGDPSQPGF